MLSTLNQNNGLYILGALMRYGISEIPVVGGMLSLILDILWPVNQADIWSSIKKEVQILINEDIEENNWLILVDIVNELKDKFLFINEQITNKQYDTAGPELMEMVITIVGIEENFKLEGADFKYAFAPLFVVTVNLKIALYIEGIKYSTELGLSQHQSEQLKSLLHLDVKEAKIYLSPINSALGDTYLNDLHTYFKVSLYYGVSASLFNALWSSDYEDYNSPTPLENYYVPVLAAGTFYKLMDLGGQDFSVVTMPFEEIAKNSMMPSTNINGVLYQEPKFYPEGFIKHINFYTDLSITHRTTGVMFTYSKSNKEYEMGMTVDNDQYFNVGQNIMNIDVDGGEFINNISVNSEFFVSRISFTTNKKNTMVAGQYNDNDTSQEVTLGSPFSINSMYVVSDLAGYIKSSGHQMCGISISAIYNNELAIQCVRSLHKNKGIAYVD